jgi:hypothetical protein
MMSPFPATGDQFDVTVWGGVATEMNFLRSKKNVLTLASRAHKVAQERRRDGHAGVHRGRQGPR